MADKYFNRDEAEELISVIGPFLESAREQKRTLDTLVADLSVAAARIMMLGGSMPPFAELNRKKTQREKLTEELNQAVEKIQQTGCVVKDLEMGLVDFPSLRGSEEVYLCWKLGEERIGFWHGIEEGFAGRKPLDESKAEDEPPKSPRLQ